MGGGAPPFFANGWGKGLREVDWLHETWRRLYVRVDGNWLSLPLSARGLFDELLRYVDEDGCLPLGQDDAAATLARILSAHANEAERLRADLDLLMADGCVTVTRDGRDASQIVTRDVTLNERDASRAVTAAVTLQIRNFRAAQGVTRHAEERTEQRRKAALRAANYRERLRLSRAPPAELESPDVTRDVRVTSRDASRVTKLPFLALPSLPDLSPPTPPRDAVVVGAPESATEPDPEAAAQATLVAVLAGCPKFVGADHAGIAAGLRGAAMSAGATSARLLVCTQHACEVILPTDPIPAGPRVGPWVRQTVIRLLRPGELERELRGGDGRMPRAEGADAGADDFTRAAVAAAERLSAEMRRGER